MNPDQASLVLQPIVVRQFIEDVAHRFISRAIEHGISLKVDASAALTIDADRGRLHRVLDNLIANALRHTESGGEIHLGAKLVPGGSGHADHVRVIVRDTGSGIPSDQLSRIFERFARASDDDSGFGLGLPIARQLVELHGGTIAIDSEVGIGTTVTVDLPIRQ